MQLSPFYKTLYVSDYENNFFPIPHETPGYQHTKLKPGWNSLYIYGAGTDLFSELVMRTMTETMTKDFIKNTIEVHKAFGKTVLTCIGKIDNKKEWIGDQLLSTYIPHKATEPGSYYILMIYTQVETGFYISCILRN